MGTITSSAMGQFSGTMEEPDNGRQFPLRKGDGSQRHNHPNGFSLDSQVLLIRRRNIQLTEVFFTEGSSRLDDGDRQMSM